MKEASDNDKASVFSGFKGFSVINSTPSQAVISQETVNKNTIEITKPSALFDNNNKSSSNIENKISATNQHVGSFFSSKVNNANPTNNEKSKGNENKYDTYELTDNLSLNKNIDLNDNYKENLKNINSKELKFINGLNELYNKCFGSTNWQKYKLPESLKTSKDSIKGVSSDENDAEANYAYMLSELNNYCAKWINNHVTENPLINLTPVFLDYFNYLILLEKKFFPESFPNAHESNSLSVFDKEKQITNGNHTKFDSVDKSSYSNKAPAEKTQINFLSERNLASKCSETNISAENVENNSFHNTKPEEINTIGPETVKHNENTVSHNNIDKELNTNKKTLFSNFTSNTTNTNNNASSLATFQFGSLSSVPFGQTSFSSLTNTNSESANNKESSINFTFKSQGENQKKETVFEKKTETSNFFSNTKLLNPKVDIESNPPSEPFKATPFFSFQKNIDTTSASANLMGTNSIFSSNLFSSNSNMSEKNNLASFGSQNAEGGDDAEEGNT